MVALALFSLAGSAGAEGIQTLQPPGAPYCDDFDPSVCLQPFPNDYFTVPDSDHSTSDTGRRINFNVLAMPRNAAGKPIDPTEWNRNDGFSPGSLITAHIPGLDNQQALDQSGGVPINNLTAYQNRAELWALLEQAFKARPAAAWVALLEQESIPVAVVNAIDQVVADPQIQHRHMVSDLAAPDAACSAGLTSCGGACVDLASDDDHCGACGTPCGVPYHCVSGACVCTAPVDPGRAA